MVTSLAEVWIEIDVYEEFYQWKYVTSLAEVWIEIRWWIVSNSNTLGHFPRGSVD